MLRQGGAVIFLSHTRGWMHRHYGRGLMRNNKVYYLASKIPCLFLGVSTGISFYFEFRLYAIEYLYFQKLSEY